MTPAPCTSVAAQPPAWPPVRRRRTTGAPAVWALGLGLGAVVAAGSLVLALLTGPRPGPVASPVVELAELGVPAVALAGVVVGIVAIVRGAQRGQKVWMGVTGLVIALATLVVWPGVFIALMIAFALSGLSG